MFKRIWLLLVCFFAFGCMYGDPGTGEDDDMKKYPHVADDHRQPIVPRTAEVIPRTGPWTGDNQLGSIVDFQQNALAQQTILKLDEWGPPEVWTISFAANKIPDDDLLTTDIVAQINFGVGGSTQTMLVDWNVGNQVSLVMNAVNVVALYRHLSIGVDDGDLKLSVQVARGARASSGVAPVFTFIRNQALAASPGPSNAVREDLPAFAKAIRILPGNVSTAAAIAAVYGTDVILSQLDNASEVIAACRASDLGATGSMPVVAGARFFRIDNLSATAIRINAIAELAG